MEMSLNENEIRFKGRVPIDLREKGQILPEKDYFFLVKAQRIEVVHHDNQDGTFDKRYVMGIIDLRMVDIKSIYEEPNK